MTAHKRDFILSQNIWGELSRHKGSNTSGPMLWLLFVAKERDLADIFKKTSGNFYELQNRISERDA